MPQWAWVSLAMIILNVLAMGIALELQAGWSSVPDPLRSWLLARTHPRQPRYVLSIIRPTSDYFRRRYRGRLQPLRGSLQPIAITQNNRNGMLRVADDNAAWQAKVEAVAALIHAGLVPQTKAIKTVFDLSPSGTNPEYQRTVAAIKARVEQLRAGERAVVLQPDGTTAPLTYPVTASGR